jgi:hypothetical protein
MFNSVFQQLEGNKFNMQTEYDNFIKDPLTYLANRKINIPSEYQNDPHGAVQYLLSSGNMNQGAFDKVFSTLQKMGFKF